MVPHATDELSGENSISSTVTRAAEGTGQIWRAPSLSIVSRQICNSPSLTTSQRCRIQCRRCSSPARGAQKYGVRLMSRFGSTRRLRIRAWCITPGHGIGIRMHETSRPQPRSRRHFARRRCGLRRTRWIHAGGPTTAHALRTPTSVTASGAENLSKYPVDIIPNETPVQQR